MRPSKSEDMAYNQLQMLVKSENYIAKHPNPFFPGVVYNRNDKGGRLRYGLPSWLPPGQTISLDRPVRWLDWWNTGIYTVWISVLESANPTYKYYIDFAAEAWHRVRNLG